MKKNYGIINIRILLGALLFCCTLMACYEDQEGCLDVSASNFDVDADIDCCEEEDCCCEYPQLTLEVSHRLLASDTINNFLQLNSPLTIDSSYYFAIENIRFYLTNLHLINSASGTIIGVEEEINLNVLNVDGNVESITVEDNFTIIKRNNFSYRLGTLPKTNVFTYDQVSFDIGIAGSVNNTLIDSTFIGHPLHTTPDSLQISATEGYIFNEIVLYRDTFSTTMADTLAIQELVPINLTLIEPLNLKRGFDHAVNLRINYLEWFKGINFVVDTKTDIEEKVAENTINVFQILE